MSTMYPLEEDDSEDTQDVLDDSIPEKSIKKVQDLPDGSSVFVVEEDAGEDDEKPSPADSDFYENLAVGLDESTLNSIASDLLEDIKSDRDSRKEWENAVNIAIKYLGIKVEEFRTVPFMRASAAFDTSLSSALMNFFSIARAELFPSNGPVKVKVIGIPTENTEDQAERVESFMNYFLTEMDSDYYSDSDKLLIYVGLFGSAFRKVVMDPVPNQPSSRLVKPQNLIINNNATSLLGSTRITHEMFLSRKEVMLREREGIYLKSVLPKVSEDENDSKSIVDKTIRRVEGISVDQTENKSLFTFYESHAEEDPKRFKDKIYHGDKNENIPRPYIITICEATKKVCDIRRNWKEGDDNYKRKECFVHYYYLPGFGLYSLGLAHLLGSNAVVLTDILRQQMDAGTLKNFPGGLRVRGMRIEENDKAIGPSEFREIETGGLPIRDAIMSMPYDEPSSVLASLRMELKNETMNLGSASQQGAPEFGTNTPVGTILAQLEVQNRIPSTILRSLHASLGYELRLLYDLFGEYFSDEPYPFKVPGKNSKVMKEDFNDKLNITPISDPNVLTATQRIVKAEALLKIASSSPELHDMREIFKRVYEAMNVQNINEILPKPPTEEEEEPMALDPVTENMYALTGKPIRADIWQEHSAHIQVHEAALAEFAEKNPEAVTLLQAHIKQHMAYMYFIQLQLMMGVQMPPLDKLQDPQIQNTIALQAAQAVEAQAKQQQEQNPPPLDPNAVMLADIEQRREAALLKEEDSKRKTETEAFKAQLKFESDKAKMESQEHIAEDKNELAIALAETKKSNLE